jgi:hypothetical protein
MHSAESAARLEPVTMCMLGLLCTAALTTTQLLVQAVQDFTIVVV